MTSLLRSLMRALPLLALAGLAGAAEFKVLVVMSYEQDNPWVREIREGIESVLAASSDISYVYLDTKVDRAGGPAKATQAWALYRQLQPQGVIAADDDAQAMFVLPYLRDQVTTPVMFNGVNAAPADHGYPTRHVSGVLERAHVRESLAFARQLMPSIRTACFMTHHVPAGLALRRQVDEEKSSYPAQVGAFHLVRSQAEITALGKRLKSDCDTLFIDSLEGIVDDTGRAMNNAEVMQVLSGVYRGPILGGNRYQVEQGAWAAVVKSGQEQGETSAEMLLQAMRGTAVDALPIVRNSKGQRVINVTALEAHGITPRPIVLRGATLVRQQAN